MKKLVVVLFGPMLIYDLVRTARRNRFILHRCLYLLGLGIVLYLVYAAWFPGLKTGRLFEVQRLDQQRLSRFAESFFTSFVLLQFAVVLIVTPAYTASAIAAEKANRTLELLFTTHLTSREIVLGILVARLGNLFLLLLAGLPVLCLLPFFGGVDPHLILASFLALIVTMVSVGCGSVLVSVHARSPLAAVLGAYSGASLYGLLCVVLLLPAMSHNIDSEALWVWISIYGVFNGGVSLACIRSAISQLRPASPEFRSQRSEVRGQRSEVRGQKSEVRGQKFRVDDGSENAGPAVDEFGPLPPRRRPLLAGIDDPLLWKELHTAPLFLANETRSSIGCGLAVFLGGFCLVLLAASGEGMFTKASNVMVRVLGIIPACLALMAIAFNASNRIASERERQTLDSLLTVPVTRGEILLAKWQASILSYRWIGLLIGAVWLLGLLTGGLHVVALPLLVFAAAVYVATLANLGLWFSSYCRTTTRALLATAVAAAFLLAGPGLLWRLLSGLSFDEEPAVWVFLILDRGVSPVQNLWASSFGYDGIPVPRLLAGLVGLGCHVLLALLLWTMTRYHFQAEYRK